MVPQVLFVCPRNAGRSPMAAALLEYLAQGRVRARSAGTEPAVQLNPKVVAAMAEFGVDLSKEVPKLVTDEMVAASDVVITMDCGDACPIHPGKRYEEWVIGDPAGREMPAVRQIRAELERRVQQLLAELAPLAAEGRDA